jgi:hypothetical protein
MHTIEVDDEVLDHLKHRAEPFVDHSPNDVLRRVLGLDSEEVPDVATATRRTRARRASEVGRKEAFIQEVLKEEFGDGFRARSPYRTMYQNGERLVYFQNFDKAGSTNLWYRLREGPLETLTGDQRDAYVVFTNPAERFAYLIPVPDLEKRASRAGWDREDLEVNIDPAENRWRELDWDLSQYLRRYGS